MQPKSYTVFKWAVYALATLLFFALQGLVLDHVRVWGLTPFLYPILPAVEAMYEGPRRGPVFALVMGLFCDILIWGPFEGFYALSFTIIALISAVIGENELEQKKITIKNMVSGETKEMALDKAFVEKLADFMAYEQLYNSCQDIETMFRKSQEGEQPE